SATASSFATLREATMTSAPSCLAISAAASPIPDEPPTTTTFLPFNTMLPPQSCRLIACADAGLALAKARQLPYACTSRIDVGGDVDVDQIRLVGGDGLANGIPDIACSINPHPLDAAGARHRREIRIVALAGPGIVEVSRQFSPAEITALQAADRRV